MLKLGAIELIVAIAEQDDAVRAVAVLIGDVPVVVHLLETDEQVVAAQRALSRDRPQHRQEEGVYHRFVRGRVLEEEQGDGVGALRAQAGGVLVDRVVELRSEEHTSELQSLMRISYAVFCLKKKKLKQHQNSIDNIYDV